MMLKVEIDRDKSQSTLEGTNLSLSRVLMNEIRVNGRRMPQDFEVTIEQDYARPTSVRLDGARPLYDTEIWIDGHLFVKVPGLLGDGE